MGIVEIDTPLKRNFNNYPIYFYKYLFNGGFYCLLVPFCFSVSKESSNWELYSSRHQKVLCAVMTVLVMYERVILAVDSLLWSKFDGKIDVIYCCTFVISAIIALTIIHLVWCKTSKFFKYFKVLQNLEFVDSRANLKMQGLSITLVTLRYTFAFVEQLLFYHQEDVHTNFLESTFARFRNTSIKIYLLANPSQNICWYYQMLAMMLHSIVVLPSIIICYAVEAIVASVIICTYLIVSDFVIFYKNKLLVVEKFAGTDVSASEQNLTQVLEAYESLREVFKLSNIVFAILFIVNFPVCLPIHVIFMGFFIRGEITTGISVLVMIVYYVSFFVQLIIAAEAHRKIVQFYSVLFQTPHLRKSSAFPTKVMLSLSHDLTLNTTSLSGGGLFNITYNFAITSIGAFVTYTMVVVQFSDGSPYSVTNATTTH